MLVNEIAPRVHNSGHWTIDGASVSSEFEQHRPGGGGLAAGEAGRRGRVEMINLIGSDDRTTLDLASPFPGACVHLYGKTAVAARAARWATSRGCSRMRVPAGCGAGSG